MFFPSRGLTSVIEKGYLSLGTILTDPLTCSPADPLSAKRLGLIETISGAFISPQMGMVISF